MRQLKWLALILFLFVLLGMASLSKRVLELCSMHRQEVVLQEKVASSYHKNSLTSIHHPVLKKSDYIETVLGKAQFNGLVFRKIKLFGENSADLICYGGFSQAADFLIEMERTFQIRHVELIALRDRIKVTIEIDFVPVLIGVGVGADKKINDNWHDPFL